MKYVADLHLHSKYSRAVSRDMVLPIMASWAKKKGIDILSTGDWTHPLWLREIRAQLEEKSDGLFQLTTNNNQQTTGKEPLFLLSVEVSSIYSQGGRLRRIHNLIFSPSFETAEKINKELARRGVNLMSDGRPIMGISSINLLELVLSIDERTLLIPCHVWTPWFSLYGSNSGFDSIEECFGKYANHIYGIETGLSSDAEMNWRISELSNRSILSFSDAHSPAKMGREATVFVPKNGISNDKITYNDITAAIKRDQSGKLEIGYTIEFYPEEGKYHYTGHRNCQVVQTPEETKTKGSLCPVCHRQLTVGVMHRVEQLAQQQSTNNNQQTTDQYGVRWIEDSEGERPKFVKLVPLLEILAEALSSTVGSVKVLDLFDRLVLEFGSEIAVLLQTKLTNLEKVAGPAVSDGIGKVRSGEIAINPGFDGEYGKVRIWSNEASPRQSVAKSKEEQAQLGLF